MWTTNPKPGPVLTPDPAGDRWRKPGLRLPARAKAGLVVVLVLAGLTPGGRLRAQETAESRAFKTAARAFDDGIYDLAERDFRRFVASFPLSPMLPEAILFQARAALEQTNLAGAITLLNAHV